MGNASWVDTVRVAVGGLAFRFFLWCNRMSGEQYFDEVMRSTLYDTACPYNHPTSTLREQQLEAQLVRLAEALGFQVTDGFDDAGALVVDSAMRLLDREKELDAQLKRLADFIMFEIPGEPSMPGSAVDTAIRLLGEYRAEIGDVSEALRALLTREAAYAPRNDR